MNSAARFLAAVALFCAIGSISCANNNNKKQCPQPSNDNVVGGHWEWVPDTPSTNGRRKRAANEKYVTDRGRDVCRRSDDKYEEGDSVATSCNGVVKANFTCRDGKWQGKNNAELKKNAVQCPPACKKPADDVIRNGIWEFVPAGTANRRRRDAGSHERKDGRKMWFGPKVVRGKPTMRKQGDYGLADTIRITCDAGYSLSNKNAATLTCNENGQWMASDNRVVNFNGDVTCASETTTKPTTTSTTTKPTTSTVATTKPTTTISTTTTPKPTTTISTTTTPKPTTTISTTTTPKPTTTASTTTTTTPIPTANGATQATPTNPKANCYSDKTSKKFYVIKAATGGMTWAQARTNCSNDNSRLAVVRSLADQSAVNTLLDKNNEWKCSGWWIALQGKKNASGLFERQWITEGWDPKAPLDKWVNWDTAHSEPDDKGCGGSALAQTCTRIAPSFGTWDDIECDQYKDMNGALCERPDCATGKWDEITK